MLGAEGRGYGRASSQTVLQLVSASASENGLALGQITTDEKSDDITAFSDLLETLDASRCIVTINAMGCQAAVTEAVTGGETDGEAPASPRSAAQRPPSAATTSAVCRPTLRRF